jgi:hypothetical protein
VSVAVGLLLESFRAILAGVASSAQVVCVRSGLNSLASKDLLFLMAINVALQRLLVVLAAAQWTVDADGVLKKLFNLTNNIRKSNAYL